MAEISLTNNSPYIIYGNSNLNGITVATPSNASFPKFALDRLTIFLSICLYLNNVRVTADFPADAGARAAAVLAAATEMSKADKYSKFGTPLDVNAVGALLGGLYGASEVAYGAGPPTVPKSALATYILKHKLPDVGIFTIRAAMRSPDLFVADPVARFAGYTRWLPFLPFACELAALIENPLNEIIDYEFHRITPSLYSYLRAMRWNADHDFTTNRPGRLEDLNSPFWNMFILEATADFASKAADAGAAPSLYPNANFVANTKVLVHLVQDNLTQQNAAALGSNAAIHNAVDPRTSLINIIAVSHCEGDISAGVGGITAKTFAVLFPNFARYDKGIRARLVGGDVQGDAMEAPLDITNNGTHNFLAGSEFVPLMVPLFSPFQYATISVANIQLRHATVAAANGDRRLINQGADVVFIEMFLNLYAFGLIQLQFNNLEGNAGALAEVSEAADGHFRHLLQQRLTDNLNAKSGAGLMFDNTVGTLFVQNKAEIARLQAAEVRLTGEKNTLDVQLRRATSDGDKARIQALLNKCNSDLALAKTSIASKYEELNRMKESMISQTTLSTPSSKFKPGNDSDNFIVSIERTLDGPEIIVKSISNPTSFSIINKTLMLGKPDAPSCPLIGITPTKKVGETSLLCNDIITTVNLKTPAPTEPPLPFNDTKYGLEVKLLKILSECSIKTGTTDYEHHYTMNDDTIAQANPGYVYHLLNKLGAKIADGKYLKPTSRFTVVQMIELTSANGIRGEEVFYNDAKVLYTPTELIAAIGGVAAKIDTRVLRLNVARAAATPPAQPINVDIIAALKTLVTDRNYLPKLLGGLNLLEKYFLKCIDYINNTYPQILNQDKIKNTYLSFGSSSGKPGQIMEKRSSARFKVSQNGGYDLKHQEVQLQAIIKNRNNAILEQALISVNKINQNGGALGLKVDGFFDYDQLISYYKSQYDAIKKVLNMAGKSFHKDVEDLWTSKIGEFKRITDEFQTLHKQLIEFTINNKLDKDRIIQQSNLDTVSGLVAVEVANKRDKAKQFTDALKKLADSASTSEGGLLRYIQRASIMTAAMGLY